MTSLFSTSAAFTIDELLHMAQKAIEGVTILNLDYTDARGSIKERLIVPRAIFTTSAGDKILAAEYPRGGPFGSEVVYRSYRFDRMDAMSIHTPDD